jgi:gliding motility-associated-like protein
LKNLSVYTKPPTTGRNRRFRILLSCSLLFLAFTSTYAQLVVSSNIGAAGIIHALAGRGLTITNIQLNCDTGAIGKFSNGNTTNLGINNGILLTSGSAYNAIGPNDSLMPASTCLATNFIDPDLTSIDSAATFDPCILQFDIIPQCNTLTFHFVFGSGEYPTFVGSAFNDAFGFFITGPNPSGPAYVHKNITLLPGGSPVSINNVNDGNGNAGPCINCQYYVNNSGGTTIQYAGLTTILTVTVALVPCATYHFKAAIADAGDCNLDSGVFIDFLDCSSSVDAIASSTPSTTCIGNGTATATASLGTPPYTYQWIPSGVTGTTLTNLVAGTYTCVVSDFSACGTGDTLQVVVGGTNGILLTPLQTNVTCNGACNGSISTTPSFGTAPYTFSWTPSGATTPSISGLCPGTDTCRLKDATGCATQVIVHITQPATLNATAAVTNEFCKAANGFAIINPSGGTTPYTYSWFPVSGGSALLGGLTLNSYTCTVMDANGCTHPVVATIGQTFAPPFATFSANPAIGTVPDLVTFIDSSSANASSWNWNFGDGSVANTKDTSHVYTTPGTYTVQEMVLGVNGCDTTITRIVIVKDFASYLDVPNIFTPNGDGKNDLLEIKWHGIETYDLKIYDRWGVLMAHFTHPWLAWDGLTFSGIKASEGTYYYVIEASGDDKKDYHLNGFFTLMR